MNKKEICKVMIFCLFSVCLLGSVSAGNRIVIMPPDNSELYGVAEMLGKTMEKMSGQDYVIVTNGVVDKADILLALTSDYRGKKKIPNRIKDNYEAFRIAANKKGLVIVGKSEKAVEDGVYTYLMKLGCRWFFPGERWTIIPQRNDIFIKFNLSDAPDYSNRNIWYQYGSGWGEHWNAKKIQSDYMKWRTANRQGGLGVSCGHSWGHIVRRNEEEFAKHPEYYAMGKDGKRIIPKNSASSKFCCSNTNLIKLVAEDSLRLLREKKKANPDAFMVSVDPSDGPHMCYCENCKKLGSGKPSDMVVNLANGVAKYLRENEPDAWVGFYAYSAHQDPPSLPLEKNIYVQMAMAFNSTEYTLDELIKIWGEKAGAIGIREYYSVMAWDYNLPGRARGANIDYHKKVIPEWYKKGARSISAESCNNWAAQGPGYYAAANLMWDINADVDTLMDDFYDKCFGPTAGPVRELYGVWNGSRPLLSPYLAQWLGKLEEASQLTTDKEIISRLNDLKAYLHYVVCYYDFESAKAGNDAREKYLRLMEYAFRIKSRNVVHSYALARRIANGKFPASVLKDLPEELRGENKNVIDSWNIFAKETCPWQQNTNEFTDVEIEQFFSADLKRFIPFKNMLKTYSDNLVIPPVTIEGAADGNCKLNSYRFKTVFYFITDGDDVYVDFKGQRLSDFTLYKTGSDKILQQERSTKEGCKIKLETAGAGLYKLIANGWFTLKFPDDLKVVYKKSPEDSGQPTAYAGPGYFFVPKGTKSFNMAIGSRLILKDPGGNILKYMSNKDSRVVTIDVPEGYDGKRWEIVFLTSGRWYFIDLPPYVSLTPDGYIGPREVFNK